MFRDAARTFFASKGWVKKALLGTLISLIPYVGTFVVYGYGLELQRRVAWDTSRELPDWSPFSTYLKRGFFGFIVAVVYSLPASLITGVLAVPLSLALGFGTAAGGDVAAFFILFMVGFVVLLLLGTAAVVPFMYSGLIEYNLHDNVGTGLQFRTVWARMKANRAALLAVTWRTIAYMSTVTLLVYAGMTPYFVFIAKIVANPAAPDANAALGYLGLQALFALAYPFLMFASFVVNQMVWIMWGRYARAAYRLAESPVQPTL
jgi:Protein of unknown function (DUF4013)